MALFDQQDWLKHFPGFFENGQPALKQFSTFQEPDRNRFLMAVIATMSVIYKGLHHFLPHTNAASLSEQEVTKQVKTMVIPAWRHGLADCSVAQILSGLFLVIGGRTEYIEFPPSAVLKFKAVCMAHRPAYHDVVRKPSNAPQLGWDKEAAEKKTAAIQKAAMIRMVRSLKEANLQNAKDRRNYKSAT